MAFWDGGFGVWQYRKHSEVLTQTRFSLDQPRALTLREGMSRKLESGQAPTFAHLDPCARKDLAKAYRLKAASLHPEKAGGHQLLCAVDTAHDRRLFAPTASQKHNTISHHLVGSCVPRSWPGVQSASGETVVSLATDQHHSVDVVHGGKVLAMELRLYHGRYQRVLLSRNFFLFAFLFCYISRVFILLYFCVFFEQPFFLF